MTGSIERFGKSLREQQIGLCEEWRRANLEPPTLVLEKWEKEVKSFTGGDSLSGEAWARLRDWYKSRVSN